MAPVAVVAPHFCAPYVVQLSVKEKFSLREGDFAITDTNGAVVVTVKGALISIHNRRLLLDAAGNPLLCLREKVNELNRSCKQRSMDMWLLYRKRTMHFKFRILSPQLYISSLFFRK